MTKEELIINLMQEMPRTDYGDYKYTDYLCRIICRVVGYDERTFIDGKCTFIKKQYDNTMLVVKAMEKKGIIKLSKSGKMFKEAGTWSK